MKLFGFDLHHDPNPWHNAPPWAIELRQILTRVLATSEITLEEIHQIEEIEEEEEEESQATQVTISLGPPLDKGP